MRINVRETDPGYRADVLGGGYSALLDNVKVEGCITADEELGMVLVIVQENGQPKLNDERTDIVTEQRYGKVEILRDGRPIGQ